MGDLIAHEQVEDDEERRGNNIEDARIYVHRSFGQQVLCFHPRPSLPVARCSSRSTHISN